MCTNYIRIKLVTITENGEKKMLIKIWYRKKYIFQCLSSEHLCADSRYD